MIKLFFTIIMLNILWYNSRNRDDSLSSAIIGKWFCCKNHDCYFKTVKSTLTPLFHSKFLQHFLRPTLFLFSRFNLVFYYLYWLYQCCYAQSRQQFPLNENVVRDWLSGSRWFVSQINKNIRPTTQYRVNNSIKIWLTKSRNHVNHNITHCLPPQLNTDGQSYFNRIVWENVTSSTKP